MNPNTHADITRVRAGHTDRYCMGDRIGLFIDHETRRDGIGKWSVAEPITFKSISQEDFAYAPMPAVVIHRDSAQELMDTLWDCGIRPTAGHGSAGQLAATERHLADLQKLVFKTT